MRTENFSGESHGDREEFQLEEKKDDKGIGEDFFELTQKLGKTFIVIMLNREVQLHVPRKESYLFH